MECFKTVLKNIAIVVAFFAIAFSVLAIVAGATVATVYVFGVGPHSVWPLVILLAYIAITIGAIGGIAECHT